MGKDKLKKNKKHSSVNFTAAPKDEVIDQQIKQLILQEEQAFDEIRKSKTVLSFPIYNNIGYVIDKIPDSILIDIAEEVKKIDLSQDNLDKKTELFLGNVKHKYNLDKVKSFEKYITFLANQYGLAFPSFFTDIKNEYDLNNDSKIMKIEFSKLWVNFIKKHEYFPCHSHKGKLSFIMWLQVPFSYEDELRCSNNFGYDPTVSSLQFIFPSFQASGINKVQINADKKYEGKIIMFPSYLNHIVYPFYSSDEYKISVNGYLSLT